MGSEPDYIVIRDPESPDSGKWFDTTQFSPATRFATPGVSTVTYTATPFIEVREDGAVAQVFMRTPQEGEDHE